jgi:hypothetical protein
VSDLTVAIHARKALTRRFDQLVDASLIIYQLEEDARGEVFDTNNRVLEAPLKGARDALALLDFIVGDQDAFRAWYALGDDSRALFERFRKAVTELAAALTSTAPRYTAIGPCVPPLQCAV